MLLLIKPVPRPSTDEMRPTHLFFCLTTQMLISSGNTPKAHQESCLIGYLGTHNSVELMYTISCHIIEYYIAVKNNTAAFFHSSQGRSSHSLKEAGTDQWFQLGPFHIEIPGFV